MGKYWWILRCAYWFWHYVNDKPPLWFCWEMAVACYDSQHDDSDHPECPHDAAITEMQYWDDDGYE